MQSTFPIPTLTLGLACWAIGIGLSLRQREPGHQRGRVAGASALASLCALATLALSRHSGGGRLADPWLSFLGADQKISLVLCLISVITTALVVLAPRRDSGGASLAGLLLIAASAAWTYCSNSLPLAAIGWGVSILPLSMRSLGGGTNLKPVQLFLGLSTILAVGTLLAAGTHPGPVTLGLLVLVVALRKGLFPMHPWLVSAFERGPLLATGLVFNTHFGAALLTRPELSPLFEKHPFVLDIVSYGALLTALISSVRGFSETMPRRLIALVCLSQASFILAGLATATDAGVTGAWVHWLVVVTASTGLIAILRILEVRVMDVAQPEGELGLAVRAPRLATGFLVCSLALIGLPGTLGYCAEDLLFHGALTTHPILGVILPLATAFNAINLFRLYSLLFLGVLPKRVIDVPDALRRERWPLAACMLILVVGGIAPGRIISAMSASKSPAASVPSLPGHAH